VAAQSVKPKQDSARQETALAEPLGPITLRLAPIVQLTDWQLEELSSLNDTLRLERNAQGDLEILPPTRPVSGHQEGEILTQVYPWAKSDGTGMAFGPTAGFTLPNGAVRSPDASWIRKSRLAELTDEQKEGFWPISPDFVIELRSSSDRLRGLQGKMEEYMENGVRLGWLIDPLDPVRRVYVYRPGAAVETLEAPESLSGDPELPGFVLDLQAVWEPGI